jgi:3-hydroxyacyl-CoA dehydrogenase
MGPSQLLDLVGAEIAMHGMETMARDFGDQYKPHPLLKKRLLAGLLGKRPAAGSTITRSNSWQTIFSCPVGRKI